MARRKKYKPIHNNPTALRRRALQKIDEYLSKSLQIMEKETNFKLVDHFPDLSHDNVSLMRLAERNMCERLQTWLRFNFKDDPYGKG